MRSDRRDAARIETLFARALELEAPARSSWLAGLSGADAELRTELESLLGHLERSSRFLAHPATDAALLAACKAAIAPTAQNGWQHQLHAVVYVKTPDGITGTATAAHILDAAERDRQEISVCQCNRWDIWFPSQLRLA